MIKGTVGDGEKGDIAVDDILKMNGICPKRGECTFEEFEMCGYLQDSEDDFDWIRGHGATKGAGPSNDHTFGNHKGVSQIIQNHYITTKI